MSERERGRFQEFIEILHSIESSLLSIESSLLSKEQNKV